MSQKVSVKIPLEFEVTLDERQINIDIELYTKDYYDYLETFKDEKKMSKLSEKEIEEYIEDANLIRQSLSETSINNLLKELKNFKESQRVTPRVKEHLKTNYKRILMCILEDAQIEEYFDDETEPTLKGNIVTFTMKFPDENKESFIKVIIIDSLKLSQSNLHNTLSESDLKYFQIKSNYAPIFTLGSFTFDPENIKIKF